MPRSRSPRAPLSRLPSGHLSRWVNIAASLRADLQRGRWPAGERLPASRILAKEFSCNRETLFAALQQLLAEGWLQSQPRRGYFVQHDVCELPLKSGAPQPFALRLAEGFEAWANFDLESLKFWLHSATPDPELLPRTALRSAYSFALRHLGTKSLELGDRRGSPRLREALRAYLRRRRALITPDLVITAGSQAALTLTARALFTAGDIVAVESPGYRPAWLAFRAAGAHVLPIRVDSNGIDVVQLEQQLGKARVRAVYVTPARQYPTTVTLSAQRRQRLLELARRHQLIIIEDDYDHEHCYRPLSIPPLAAAAEAANVVYLGTLSKLISPSIRVGFVAGPDALLQRISELAAQMLGSADAITQAAIALFIEDGGLERHLARTRRIYEARRDALFDALTRHCPAIELTRPDGGLALYGSLAGVCSLALARAAVQHGVALVPEGLLTESTAPVHGMRLAFSRLAEASAPPAAAALARAIASLSGQPQLRGRAHR